jgi:hypothetical protein
LSLHTATANPSIEGMPKKQRLLCSPYVQRQVA